MFPKAFRVLIRKVSPVDISVLFALRMERMRRTGREGFGTMKLNDLSRAFEWLDNDGRGPELCSCVFSPAPGLSVSDTKAVCKAFLLSDGLSGARRMAAKASEYCHMGAPVVCRNGSFHPMELAMEVSAEAEMRELSGSVSAAGESGG